MGASRGGSAARACTTMTQVTASAHAIGDARDVTGEPPNRDAVLLAHGDDIIHAATTSGSNRRETEPSLVPDRALHLLHGLEIDLRCRS